MASLLDSSSRGKKCQTADVSFWPLASFRCDAEFGPLSAHIGHQVAISSTCGYAPSGALDLMFASGTRSRWNGERQNPLH
jgi:hypothetical protein